MGTHLPAGGLGKVVAVTRARGPGGVAEHMLAHAGRSHHLPGLQGSRPVLDLGPGCPCTAHCHTVLVVVKEQAGKTMSSKTVSRITLCL